MVRSDPCETGRPALRAAVPHQDGRVRQAEVEVGIQEVSSRFADGGGHVLDDPEEQRDLRHFVEHGPNEVLKWDVNEVAFGLIVQTADDRLPALRRYLGPVTFEASVALCCRALRNKQDAGKNEGEHHCRRRVSAQSQAAGADRLVEKVAYDGSERARQDERCP